MMEYSISQMTSLLGITAPAMHYFEREGLVHPRRAPNGRRIYSDTDLFIMISYKKYRSMHMTLKDVVNHTQHSTLQGVTERIIRARQLAQEQLEYYIWLEKHIAQHVEKVSKIGENLGRFEITESPEVLFLADLEKGLVSDDAKIREALHTWIEKLPETYISLRYDTERAARPGLSGFGLTISPQRAKELALPIEVGVSHLPSKPCVHVLIATEIPYECSEHWFDVGFSYLESKGLRCNGTAWGTVVVVEVPEEPTRLKTYVELWYPIVVHN